MCRSTNPKDIAASKRGFIYRTKGFMFSPNINLYKSLSIEMQRSQNLVLFFYFLILLGCSQNVVSEKTEPINKIDYCLDQAGKRYNIDPLLLKAIAIQESALNPRASNSVGDIGLMQINPQWLPKLSEFNISQKDLWDPCVNAAVGAWILAHNFHQYGRNWRSVGIYHAGTSKNESVITRASEYSEKIKKIYFKGV